MTARKPDVTDIITPEIEDRIAALGKNVRQRIAWLKTQVSEDGQHQLDAMYQEMIEAVGIKEDQLTALMALTLEIRSQRDQANEELADLDAAQDSIIEDIAATLDISTFDAYDVLAAITGDGTNQLTGEQAEIVRRLFNQAQEGAA